MKAKDWIWAYIALAIVFVFLMAMVVDTLQKNRQASALVIIECIKAGRTPVVDDLGWFKGCTR